MISNEKQVPAEGAHFGVLEGSTQSEAGALVMRSVALARCLRCGFEWLPRVECPAKCARCFTPYWNVPRANHKQGRPEPTRRGRPRGRSMPKPPLAQAPPVPVEEPPGE